MPRDLEVLRSAVLEEMLARRAEGARAGDRRDTQLETLVQEARDRHASYFSVTFPITSVALSVALIAIAWLV